MLPLPRELLWAVIFALSVFLIFSWQGPHQQALPVTHHQAQETKSGVTAPQLQNQHPPEVTFLGVKPGEWLLVIVTWMLWLATARLVRGADRNAEMQLRAYLGVHTMHAAIHPFEGGGFRYLVTAELRNFGQTPAHELRLRSNSTIAAASAAPFDQAQGPATESGPIIASRDSGYHATQWGIISEQEIAEIRLRQKCIFLWGTATYRDVFGRQRHFTFRIMNSHEVAGQPGVFAMAAHPMGYEGN
jgi:hypothetical protein